MSVNPGDEPVNVQELARYKEMLSSLSDGELGPAELRELLRFMEADSSSKESLHAFWNSLHVSRQVLKQDYSPPVRDLHCLLKAELQKLSLPTVRPLSVSPEVISPKRKGRQAAPWQSFAVAASVMFSVLFIWLAAQAPVREAAVLAFTGQDAGSSSVEKPANVNSLTSGQLASLGRNQAQRLALPSGGAANSGPASSTGQSGKLYLSEKRLGHYMRLHANNASLNGNQGMMPFARVESVEQF